MPLQARSIASARVGNASHMPFRGQRPVFLGSRASPEAPDALDPDRGLRIAPRALAQLRRSPGAGARSMRPKRAGPPPLIAGAPRRASRAIAGRRGRTGPVQGPGEEEELQGVSERNFGQLRGQRPGELDVPALHCALELAVGSSLRRHEHMFAQLGTRRLLDSTEGEGRPARPPVFPVAPQRHGTGNPS
jgi:hypothetical protein